MRVQFGDITLDSASRQLVRGGAAIHLSPKAFELLCHLVVGEQLVCESQEASALPRASSKEEALEKAEPLGARFCRRKRADSPSRSSHSWSMIFKASTKVGKTLKRGQAERPATRKSRSISARGSATPSHPSSPRRSRIS